MTVTLLKRHHVWLEYGLLALLILGPLLLPGYILTLDMIWTPHTPGGMLSQKLILLGIFIFAGVGAHKLAQDRVGQWPAYIAGLLYAVNPFTYTRLMAGQYLFLVVYALLPWFVRALVRVLERPRPRRGIALVVWAWVIGAVSIHAVGFMALLAAVVVGAWSWGRWRAVWRKAGWCLLAVAGAWLVASAYWIVPLVAGHSDAARTIAGVGSDQLAAYASGGGGAGAGGAGVALNVAALQGFWADSAGRYVLPSSTGALFWTAWAALMMLVLAGGWRAWRRRDRVGLALAAAGLIAWVLAIGVAWAPVGWISRPLINYLPFYRGYREPQKWAAVLALAYAYLAAGGLTALRERLRGTYRDAATVAAALLPFIMVPMLLWGAAGQLRSAQYPASWAGLNQRLGALPPGGIVMLPWHQYLALDFAGRTVANPAPQYFDRPLITSHDPELLSVVPSQPESSRAVQDDVLAGRYFITDAGTRLAHYGVRYVVLLKQADWHDYDWLNRQTGLKLIAESSGWKLYEVAP
jgi:hypothetical protein